MKILVLGNGFDKLHMLPTGYKDFLEFIKLLYSYDEVINRSFILPRLKVVKEDIDKKYKFASGNHQEGTITDEMHIIQHVPAEELENFYEKSKNSFWIDYFLEHQEIAGDKWLNFEEELERVVKEVFNEDYKEGKVSIANKDVALFYRHNKKGNIYSKEFELDFYNEYKLLVELLKKYMSYVNLLNVDPVDKYHFDEYELILTFNYTDTFERLYNQKRKQICHIHGKSNGSIVLGFDDHYLQKDKVISQHIKYQKYYQRIVNNNDNNYTKWKKSVETPETIDIFGHSLSPEDGDIFRYLISNYRETRIRIFYLDDDDRADKIANLAIILGPEQLIELTNGENSHISFKKIENIS